MQRNNIDIVFVFAAIGHRAARTKRFDFEFQDGRRADNCQYVKNIASSSKQVRNRVHAKFVGHLIQPTKMDIRRSEWGW